MTIRSSAPLLVLVAFVASCMLPQDQYGQYGQYGQYQQGYGSPPASHSVRVVYEPPTRKPEREEIRTFLQTNGSFEKVARGLTLQFELPQDVDVVWTECGAVNAAWDGRRIVMCYEMAEFLKTLFGKKIQNKEQLRLAVMSSLMFVFLHEVGHGLISIYKLPSVGREEDAADQLASLVLISTGDVGLEVAMRGAQFFRVLALSGAKLQFFDEHSLDAQRYYNLMCLVYGSSPDRLASMVGNDKLPASRARRCPTEYSKVSSAWSTLLTPYTRKSGGRPSAPSYGDDDDNSGYADQRTTGYPRNPGYGNSPRNPGYGNSPRNPGYGNSPRNPGYGNSPHNNGNSGYPRSQGNSGGSSSGQWLCRAVGSYVPSGSDGPDYSDPQNVDASKVGRTRDEAGLAALDSCAGMLALSTNISLYPNALVQQYCKVISCTQ